MRCSKCGIDNKEQAQFCKRCGTVLYGSQPESRQRKRILVIVILLVAAAGR
ncbi:MAG: zinc-ribbon domain-containing protein [Firmicutes bacterium]|nr:zinc-ribbon domain-containing protein [Bacillota bacterium]